MDELFSTVKKEIEKKINLVPLDLPEELARMKLPFGLMDMICNNFTGERIRKIYFMRFKAMPSLDVFGMAIYPMPIYDLPIFVSDLSSTRKKVFTYINYILLFNEPSYLKKYLEPLKEISEKYNHFPTHKARDWMRPYLSPFTVYSLVDKTRLDELKRCVLDYLKLYLDLLLKAEEIKDLDYLNKIADAHNRYIKDLTTQDASRKMLGRLIGREKANRIFNEVVS